MKFFWTDLQDLFLENLITGIQQPSIPAAGKERTCGTALGLGDVF